MQKLLYPFLILLAITLTACPYDAEVALTTYDEATKTNKNLYGEWIHYNKETGESEELKITKANKNVYNVQHDSYNAKGKKTDDNYFRAFGKEIGEVDLLSLEGKDGSYIYVKYVVTSKNTFDVYFVNEEFVENNFSEEVTQESLVAFFTKNINEEGFFDEKIEFLRIGSSEHQLLKMWLKKSGF